MISESTRALCAVEPCLTRGSSFVDDFYDGNNSVFVDDFWVDRGCLCFRIHVSPLEAVSLMISESIAALCSVESIRHPWKQFRWWFLSQQRLCFRWLFLRPQGCLRCRIHASPVAAVSLMISKPTWAICAVESMRHSWKQFCWWFLRRQWLSFRSWFVRPQGFFVVSNPCVTRGSSFVEDFWVPRLFALSNHPWKHFRWWFLSR